MTTLNIGGRNVEVDDSFLKLSPADKQSTVDEIASSFAAPVTANSAVRSAATGVPVIGGLLNNFDAATNAALAPVLNPLFDPKDQLSEPTFGERYAHSLRDQQGADTQFATDHPTVDTALKLAGAVGGTLPAMAAAPAAFGLTGGLPGMIMRGAASNAALGGTDALTRGEDPLVGAGLGGILGAAGPVAATAAHGVVAPIVSQFTARIDPTGFARRQVARAISESGTSTADIAAAVGNAANEGQGVFNVADAMGSAGQGLLSSVARAPGEGRTNVVNALEGRQGTQGRRISNALATGFNAPETAAQTEARLTAARGADADAAYGAVRNDASPVDVTGTLNHLDRIIGTEPGQVITPANDSVEAALTPFRQRLSRVNPDDFEAVQRIRGDMADAAQSAQQTGNGNRARLIGGAVRQLDSAMENASPGYRAANANFAQASRNIDAVQTGRNAAMRGRTEDTIPAFQALQPPGQQAFRSGYVDPLIAQTQGAAFGVNKARPLLNSAFQDEAGAMAPGNPLMQRQLGREQTMFETRNAALGGSKTADNLANADALGIDPSLVGHIVQHNYGAAVKSVLGGAFNGITGNTPAVRAAVSKILLQSGANVTPAALDRMVGETVARIQAIQRLARTGTRGATAVAAITSNANNNIFRRANR